MKDHKDLDVWKKGIDLVAEVYRTTAQFPKEEVFGLTSQMRRAAVSIPANVAEGAARQTDKEFVQFLFISLGSASELETELLIAEKLGFCNASSLSEQITSVKMMLNGLIRHYRNKS